MRVAFYTLGCKVNQYESEAMSEIFEKRGYREVGNDEFSDVYIVNTCTVTNLSDRKSRQFIRKSKKKNPDSVVAVVGCYSQVSPDEVKNIEGVDVVIGTTAVSYTHLLPSGHELSPKITTLELVQRL